MGINNFKKGYDPITDIIKDEKGHWVPDSHSILAKQRNHFSQLLNVHGVNDVRQTEIHTAESLEAEPCASEVKMATEKLRHKSLGTDHIPAELMHGVEKFGMRSINLLILFEIRRNCLRSRRS
jgi:hypothetical protein